MNKDIMQTFLQRVGYCAVLVVISICVAIFAIFIVSFILETMYYFSLKVAIGFFIISYIKGKIDGHKEKDPQKGEDQSKGENMKINYWLAAFLFSIIFLVVACLEAVAALYIAFAVTDSSARVLLALLMTILAGLPTGFYLLGKFGEQYKQTAEDKKEE